MARQPTTMRDEISSIAGKILGRARKTVFASAASYNDLLADATKLAGFVLRSDPAKGANPKKPRKHVE